MAVIDLPASEEVVRPDAPEDARPSLRLVSQRFSSPAARGVEGSLSEDQTRQLAAELDTSERALSAAHGMLQRHLSTAGEGQAGSVTATLDGIRRAHLSAKGLIVQGRRDALNVGIAVIADPLVLLAVGGSERTLHWSLLPGGPSVTSRANGLRMIRALAAGGELMFSVGTGEPLPPLDVDRAPWNDEEEWRLFEDLAVLEEWSGVLMPMPEVVSATEATLAAQAASWARTQQIDARMTGPITFTAMAHAIPGRADEVRLHQDFGVELMEIEIPLGEGVALVGVDRVAPANDDPHRSRLWPDRSDVLFRLRPPPGRTLPPRRTQPEHVPPPVGRSSVEDPTRAVFTRRARRQLPEVLTELSRREEERQGNEFPLGTADLLDGVRGD